MTNLITNIIEQIYNTDQVIKKVNVAGGIIFKEQPGEKPALLLIQRAKDDHWPNFFEFPRGKCDFGKNEALIHCLKREVKEETGIDIIPLKFIDKFSYTADEGKRLSTQHNFLCKMKDPNQKVKLSKEHQGFQWITTPGEAELTVLPEMKRSIIKAFELIDPDTQLVNYPENDFTPDGIIEENIGQRVGQTAVIGGTILALKKWNNKRKKPEYQKCSKLLKWTDRYKCHKALKKNKKIKENNMNLQEKIKYSQDLIDKYLNEGGADLANTLLYGYNTARGVVGDFGKLKKYTIDKIAAHKKKKERLKKEKLRLAMKRKYEQKAKEVGTL